MKHIEKRASNTNRVYRLIYAKGSASKPEIALELGISLPTAIHSVFALQDAGLVCEGELLESTGGRKAQAVRIDKNARFALGIDITRKTVSIALINLAAEIIQVSREKIDYQDSPDYYRYIVEKAKQIASSTVKSDSLILGAAYSLPAIISEDGSRLVYSRVLDVPVLYCETVSRGLPYQAVFCNDANAAGEAELWQRRDVTNAVYLSLSGTVGGAILLGGEVYKGEHQRGGEFGHSTLVKGGAPCYCGRRGCVDAYISASLLERAAGGDLALFFQKLDAGDGAIQEVWDEYLGCLAACLNNLIASFDCPIILGGTLGAHIEKHIGRIREEVQKVSTFLGAEECVTHCLYKKEASAVGAALLYVKRFISAI